MHRTAGNRRIGVALAAAIVLFLQGLFGAYANAAFVATAPLDAFGNPLCVTMPDETGLPGKHDPAAMPGCCTLACQPAASLLPTEPAGEVLAVSGAWIAIGPLLPRALALPRHASHAPGNPRAPPLCA